MIDTRIVGLLVQIAFIAFIFYKAHRHRSPARRHGLIIVGLSGKVYIMSFNIKPGQTGTATAVFVDTTTTPPTPRPLAPGLVPVWAVTPPDAVALAPVATSADGSTWTCGLTGGSNPEDFAITCTGEGDPTPGVDTIVATIAGVLLAPEDNAGTISVALN